MLNLRLKGYLYIIFQIANTVSGPKHVERGAFNHHGTILPTSVREDRNVAPSPTQYSKKNVLIAVVHMIQIVCSNLTSVLESLSH